MNFIGATRKQSGKNINDDAFAVFNGTFAFLLDGAGNARGAAKRCADIIRQQYQQQSLMPPFPHLINLLNMTLIGLDAESTFVGIEIKQGNFLSGVSCGDSLVYVIRDGKLLRINENTKPPLGTSRPDIYWMTFALKNDDVIVVASDGVTLDKYRLAQTVQRYMLRHDEMAEALLKVQADCSDDATVITTLVRKG
jgi:serine/threonine protein phosphatase PrpC